MLTKEELCKKIVEIYPDIGFCDIELIIDCNNEKKAWAVDLKKQE